VTTRVYVPCTPRRLRGVRATGGVGPSPEGARTALGEPGDEEEEYAAATAAAQVAVGLLEADEPARRIVLAADLPLGRVSAVLCDAADAEPVVAAARDAVARGDGDAELDRCLDHELGWWAVQEIDALLMELGEDPR
jgi:hypothetical protein